VPLLNELVDRIPKDYQDLVHTFLSNQTHQLALSRIAELEKNTRSQYPSEIFPAYGDVFNALIQTPVNSVKVILLGQDPYHSPGLAQGLAFSIPEHIATSSRAFPSSLRNISKALVLDDFDPLPHGDLISWAQQGVLLLNTCLTVNMGNAHSHQAWGWQLLTDAIIQALSQQHAIVWLLWGKVAQKKSALIVPNHRHLVLSASHPSGLGAYQTAEPFLYKGDQRGCGHFKKTNDWLIEHHKTPIQWSTSWLTR
jgi:uracil-DNA glycosylase